MRKRRRHLSPPEPRERDRLDQPADEAIAAIAETGPHPAEEWEEDPGEHHSE